MTGVLKRKYEELEDDSTCSSSSASPLSSLTSSGSESDEEYTFSAKPFITDFIPTSIVKKGKHSKKNNVAFDRVVVFYFQRCQGFTSIPSRGGCTLGMRKRHHHSRQYTLEEFSKEQLDTRQEKLKERLKEEKLESLKNMLTMNGTKESEKANNLSIDDICDEDIDINSGEMDDGFSPRMYPPKKRRALLKREGLKKIDKSEKHELNEIRRSRENCGCSCQDFCDPETCSCNLAGIKCQRDHSNFPCGCTKEGCGNQNGRIEFNSSRVQTHFIHTVMRLELEEKHKSSIRDPEESRSERLNSQVCTPVVISPVEERTSPPIPAFQFAVGMETVGENSCSSDMTDTSSSSNQSEDSEEPYETPPSDKSQSDVDDDYLARILHFNDSEYEENSSDCQDNLSFFHPADFFCDNIYQPLSCSEKFATGPYSSSLSKCLDDNANQDTSGFSDDAASSNAPSDYNLIQTDTNSKSYTDISLSSDSLDLFQAYPDYNLGPLYNSLKEYENVDNLSFQLPTITGINQSGEQTSCFLESLIGLSESIPDTPAPFTDNLLLEDAFKSSLMETLTV
ncbi:hypothetical protein GDO86_012080 [Hymenochirus boettgeri]|uniref:Cysteine/serine-rich nuclear protein N-terminal domain-containing protein n=1 Tax=Hymenochirus boettgeri TaxID=247094 RepID=A0A8T2JJ30_9PIPI|nr:hypothetical protein GDO86_012080 [Hymenochirus boettgeri]